MLHDALAAISVLGGLDRRRPRLGPDPTNERHDQDTTAPLVREISPNGQHHSRSPHREAADPQFVIKLRWEGNLETEREASEQLRVQSESSSGDEVWCRRSVGTRWRTRRGGLGANCCVY